MLQEIIEYLDTLKNAATAYCDLHRPLRANAFNDIRTSRYGVRLFTSVIN